jgi:hypothetical protein
MQGRSECRVDLQESFRRSLERLVGGVADIAEA